jgi:hypothetical protein
MSASVVGYSTRRLRGSFVGGPLKGVETRKGPRPRYSGWYCLSTRITFCSTAPVRILDVTERNMLNAKKRSEGAPVELINGDRRHNRRYDIPLEVRWKRMRRGKVLEVGTGETIDISSGGILFRAEKALPLGDRLELAVGWPVLADNFPRLQLIVSGIVVRSNGTQNAITMIQHEFRTLAVVRHNVPEDESKVFSITAHRS